MAKFNLLRIRTSIDIFSTYKCKVTFGLKYTNQNRDWLDPMTSLGLTQLTKLQMRACKVILENEYEDLDSARMKLNILSFDQNLFLNKAKTMYKVANGLIPQYIIDLFQSRADSCLIS